MVLSAAIVDETLRALVVSGDPDLLTIKEHQGVRIVFLSHVDRGEDRGHKWHQ